jgi:DNA-binding NarL/FixJ family response regulator
VFLALIVEDNIAFCANLYSALQARFPFVKLAIAGGVRDALMEIELARPDLIFVDVALGDGNGLELTRRLRASGVDSVVIVLTVHDIPEYRDEAIRSGADRFMVKGSIDFCDIFDVVQSMLAPRFRALVVAEEREFEDQVSSLLSQVRPNTVIARAADLDDALRIARTLKPNLVVLGTTAGAERERSFCDSVHADQPEGSTLVVSVYDSNRDRDWVCPSDYCLTAGAAFEQEMNAIVNSLLASRGQNSVS